MGENVGAVRSDQSDAHIYRYQVARATGGCNGNHDLADADQQLVRGRQDVTNNSFTIMIKSIGAYDALNEHFAFEHALAINEMREIFNGRNRKKGEMNSAN